MRPWVSARPGTGYSSAVSAVAVEAMVPKEWRGGRWEGGGKDDPSQLGHHQLTNEVDAMLQGQVQLRPGLLLSVLLTLHMHKEQA